MGTSGAFGGSGGKDAKDLRDNIADWLTDTPAPAPADDGEATPDGNGVPDAPVPNIDLRPTIRILTGRGGGGDGPGSGGGGAPAGGNGTGGRSSGGARRSVGTTSRAAGRAGALARAYASGDRTTLERAGLDYDELLSLGDMVAVGTRIVEAAFESQADSTVADDESRETVAEIVEWVLEAPADQTPTPDDIVRRSIEIIITNVTLTEVGDRIRAESSREKRRAAEQEIRDAAEVFSSQVTLSNTGASSQELSGAIEAGIKELGQIFGGGR
ncbi:hypothetical protein [Rhodococcus aetherivorans]|uniref:hypothetical protein n=1 Tax=Rhodococcus aetherivorans TaxID=191292 RepID=UPI00294A515C|nr:hypothetical protein [Rhodococcus aetherivorans]MDV6291471.1 hypothetical protein [Rhodococcus aetherivorans]